MSRLPKLEADQMSADQKRVVAEITSGPRGEVRGPFIPLLHNPKAADAVQRMGSFLRFDGTLPGALREMVILVVARQWTAQYEWFAHHKIALDEGLDPAIADAIAARKEPVFSDPLQKIAYDHNGRSRKVRYLFNVLCQQFRRPETGPLSDPLQPERRERACAGTTVMCTASTLKDSCDGIGEPVFKRQIS